MYWRDFDRSIVRVQNLNLETLAFEEPISQGRSFVVKIGSWEDKEM